MTDRSKTLEAMARAMCAADGFVWEDQFSPMTSANGGDNPESYLHAAAAALAAYESHLSAEGMTVVFLDDELADAACRAAACLASWEASPDTIDDVSAEIMRRRRTKEQNNG